MKLQKKIGLAALLIGLSSSPLLAADYSTMSTSELASIRGTLYNATVEDRNEFRNEWQSRLVSMSLEERQEYMRGPGKKSFRRGNGQMNRNGKRGSGNRGRRN